MRRHRNASRLHKRLKYSMYLKPCFISSTVVVHTHLRSSRRPLSPRWDRAGFSWIRAWRLACEAAQQKSESRNHRHTIHQSVWFFTALVTEECISSILLYCVTLSSQASSSMSRASMDTALLWSWSCVTSNSMPQLLKNSTPARSSTRRCLVAYSLHVCSVRQEALWEKERSGLL